MKVTTLAIAAGTLVIAGAATADFTTATIVNMGDIGGGVDTWQVFLNFSSPVDRLLAVGGTDGVANLAYQSLDAAGNASGEALVNAGGGFAGAKQEDFAQFPISLLHDSWVTIGASGFAGNSTDYSPGFAGSDGVNNIIFGSSFGHDAAALGDGGYFNGDPGNGAGDAGVSGSVLIAQFTVSNFSYGGTASYTPEGGSATNVAFFASTVAVPAPGALAMLGLAGIAARRRRRG